MTPERFEEIKARAKMFNDAVRFYGVHELIERVEMLERELLEARAAQQRALSVDGDRP
jgi:uncharacterized small protein (DUF1192 family)